MSTFHLKECYAMKQSHLLQRFVVILTAAVALLHHAGSASAQPVLTPAEVSACPSYTVTVNFTVTLPGSGGDAASFRWQIQTSPGVWATIGNDPMPLPCGGGAFAYASSPFSSQTPVGVHACSGVNAYQIRCLVTTTRGTQASNIATVTLCCPGDTNCDSAVNIDDLVSVITAWGSCPQPCSSSCHADVTHDCSVNIDDLVFVITHWAG